MKIFQPNIDLDVTGVVGTCANTSGLLLHTPSLTKLHPDVEQNGPEIKTAYEARTFKAKQGSALWCDVSGGKNTTDYYEPYTAPAAVHIHMMTQELSSATWAMTSLLQWV